jgi:integrase
MSACTHGLLSVCTYPCTKAACTQASQAHANGTPNETRTPKSWGEKFARAGTDTGYVFTREDGVPLTPRQASDAFASLVKQADVPRISGIHALRHTWATLALQAGVHPKVVAERLGHSSVRITLDTYSHVTAGMQKDAAARVARLIGLD